MSDDADDPFDGSPVDRPPEFDPDDERLLVYTPEDVAELCAEQYTFVREIPGIDEGDAEEIATMTYELFTDDWAQALREHEDDDPYR